jgi:hypothetical protein
MIEYSWIEAGEGKEVLGSHRHRSSSFILPTFPPSTMELQKNATEHYTCINVHYSNILLSVITRNDTYN